MEKKAIIIDPKDLVALVAKPVEAGDQVWIVEQRAYLQAKDSMKTGHKIALYPIKKGDLVIKYGIPIGRASADITPGEWVHVYNLEDITCELCDEYAKQYREEAMSNG